MPKLTKRLIDEAKPTTKPAFLWDSEVPGFGALVLASGVKSFIFQYRNEARRSRRLTIGRYGAMTVDEARALAREAAVKVSKGGDPVSARRAYREAPTMAQLLDRYLSEHVSNHNAESTAKDVAALIEKHMKPRLGSIKANDLKRSDAAKLHTAMKQTPRRANYALAILSKALSLAEVWGIRPENTNPCGSIQRYQENHRTRFLSAEEVTPLGEALVEAETIGLPWRIEDGKANSKHLPKDDKRRTPLSWQTIAAVRLLLLTGARLNEIISLKWTDVDATAGTIALPGKKGGKREPHPVSAAVLAILASLPRPKGASHVLPRDSDPKRHISREVMEAAWQRLRWCVGIEDVRIHDLRHTIGTYAAQSGVSSFIVRDLLRHRNITTTARYANFDAKPVRQISNTLGDMLTANLEGQTGAQVVPFGRGVKAT